MINNNYKIIDNYMIIDKVSKLVFYTQSTGTVISGRLQVGKGKWKEKKKETPKTHGNDMQY